MLSDARGHLGTPWWRLLTVNFAMGIKIFVIKLSLCISLIFFYKSLDYPFKKCSPQKANENRGKFNANVFNLSLIMIL